MAEEKKVPQLSPIQPKDVAEKEEWRKKHVRDLDVSELCSVAQAMSANKVIVIGINDEFKEMMVSVLQLPPHEYEGVMRHLVREMDAGRVHQRVNGEVYMRRTFARRVKPQAGIIGTVKRWLGL